MCWSSYNNSNQKGELDQLVWSFLASLLSLLKGEVDLLAGLVWLSPQVAESFLKLHSLPPVDACTYIGADSGGKANIRLFSLSFHFHFSLRPSPSPFTTTSSLPPAVR